MSGIFGIVHLDKQPVNLQHMHDMADAMKHWGPDGMATIVSGGAAFGHALLMATHESRFEKMPYHDKQNDVLFVAAARLDNRDELCDMFGVPLQQRPTVSDGWLVWLAYQKWGSETCKKIFGDWSFAVWHGKEQRLFLARDHLGNTGLYYYFTPSLIVFASNTETVLAHQMVPRKIDELRLAKHLSLDVRDTDWSRTFWEKVFYLPSAHMASFERANTQIHQYWTPFGAPRIHYSSENEYLEGFLDLFKKAVRVRLNSIRPIGTTLSAGLDSSSVTALASEILKKEDRPLVAYTAIPLYPTENSHTSQLNNEWHLAHHISEYFNNIDHIPIQSNDLTPLQAIQRGLQISQEPKHVAINMGWIVSLLDHAKRHNIGVMLTGQLGNGSISWTGGTNRIFYLFIQHRWLDGIKALHEWKKYRNFSLFRAMKSQIIRPVVTPLIDRYQRFANPFYYEQLNFYPNKEFIKKMGLKSDRSPYVLPSPSQQRAITMIRNGTVVGPFWNSLGSNFGMEVRDPTADTRLIEYCFGLPDEEFSYDGGDRMVIRRAMEKHLPDPIRLNTRHGRQSSDILQRILYDQGEMDRTITRMESSPVVTRYIDVNLLRKAWQSCKDTPQNIPTVRVSALLRAVTAGLFLLSINNP